MNTTTTTPTKINNHTWKLLFDACKKVKKASKRGIYVPTEGDNGFRVPIDIKNCPGKGRGVYTTELIPKGTIVQASCPCACFYTERAWRMFLSLLPLNLARDVVIWSYASEEVEDGETYQAVYLDMGESSLMNHGGPPTNQGGKILNKEDDSNGQDEENLLYTDDDTGHLIAARDIEIGEELLTNYNNFLLPSHNLEWFRDTIQEYRHPVTISALYPNDNTNEEVSVNRIELVTR